MIQIWLLLVLPVLARANVNFVTTFCGDKNCPDDTGSCYAVWKAQSPFETHCVTRKKCIEKCNGQTDCCCYLPNLEGQPPRNCKDNWNQDRKTHGKRYCYEGDQRQSYDDYPLSFPIQCLVTKGGKRYGTTSKTGCDTTMKEGGCCCAQDNCNKDLATCRKDENHRYCGYEECDDFRKVCYAQWYSGKRTIQCVQGWLCPKQCQSDCCCYEQTYEQSKFPPPDCQKDWAKDVQANATKHCYQGNKEKPVQYHDYPRLLPARCIVENDKKNNTRDVTHSKARCRQTLDNGGCCCQDNVCNKDMKTCRKDIEN